MYDPTTARFLQEDTYRGTAKEPLSLNLYTYCANNPIMYTDPTGHLYQGQTIQSGSTGDDVVQLQKRLEALGYLTMPKDSNGNKVAYGYFGGITEVALNRYKADNKLQNTVNSGTFGKAGATTWQHIGLKLKSGPMPLVEDVVILPSGITLFPATVVEDYTSQGFTRAQALRLTTLNNTIKNHLTPSDFSGVELDLKGTPVLKRSGVEWQHLNEMNCSYDSLKSVENSLEKSLQNPNLKPEVRQHLQEKLKETASYIQRIEALYEKYGKTPGNDGDNDSAGRGQRRGNRNTNNNEGGNTLKDELGNTYELIDGKWTRILPSSDTNRKEGSKSVDEGGYIFEYKDGRYVDTGKIDASIWPYVPHPELNPEINPSSPYVVATNPNIPNVGSIRDSVRGIRGSFRVILPRGQPIPVY